MKKKIIILFLFTLMSSLIFGQSNNLLHTTTNPSVQESALKAEIISVNIFEQLMIVRIQFKSRGKSVDFAVPSGTQITDFYNPNIKYLITKFENYELNKEYNIGKKGRMTAFDLTFLRISPGIELINIEIPFGDGSWGYKWKGVSINNPDDHPKTNWSEDKLKAHWLENGSEPFEGIYENTANTQAGPKYMLAVKKEADGYNLIYLSGVNNLTWKEGDLKASLSETAKPNLFKVKWYMSNKVLNENLFISFEDEMMKIVWSNPNGTKSVQQYLKLYPPVGTLTPTPKSEVLSGTGFALSSDGYIITNQHIINNAKGIRIRGVDGDFSTTYSAKVIIEDKNNDLAILKIEDINFEGLNTIPYTFKESKSALGEEVYSLGYPLGATIADDIKLNFGMISSKTGFQGDITSNQINFSVQAGNSGGPLLNMKGEIIGILNAKHASNENNSDAIKTNYLMNLTQILDSEITLPDSNTISSGSLSSQVQWVKDFVYIIEIK